MSSVRLDGVRIAGLASAVPERESSVEEDFASFGRAEVEKISKSTGIFRRRVASKLTASDLCAAAAFRALAESRWDRDTIDALVMVTQTPDYLLPATSCVLHGRLGLAKSCAAFDVNLGCSGYVYGLWLAAQIIASGAARRALLLVGDTLSRSVSPGDRSVALLFGDAGTATLLEADQAAGPMTFVLGTDGGGYEHLIVPAGGARHPRSEATSRRTERPDGNVRSDEDVFMAGAEVFTFTLREIPPLVRSLLAGSGWAQDDVDAFVFHQANEFMVRYLGKSLRLDPERVIVAVRDRGNTSGASIPLAINDALRAPLQNATKRLALVGFGVGFSWAAAALSVGPIPIPEVVSVAEPTV